MMRRDYLLRMIEEFSRMFARLGTLKQEGRWPEAEAALDGEFQKLMGADAATLAGISETELQARLMREGPTHAFGDKVLVLTTLLKEAGDVAAAEEKIELSEACYLKALHLLLETLARDEVFECPAFVPKVETLYEALQGSALPSRTQAALMQHFERIGEFAKAEDMLFALRESVADAAAVEALGLGFYQRLLVQGEEALAQGNLPRAEVEAGLAEWRGKVMSES